MSNLTQFSQKHLTLVEEELLQFLHAHTNDTKLAESMAYSIHAGGKRIRPLLMLVVYSAFQEKLYQGVYQSAAALEMIHTYSLIHDDLPAMDDDDLRRGKPTNHKVFGEAIAILAGDGLLTLAFQLLASSDVADAQKLRLLLALAEASGTEGMVAGQAADIQGEEQQLTLEELMNIHARKTGKLIEYAVVAGGVLANQSEEVLAILIKMAQHLGLAFQIRDDLLDVVSTPDSLGKNTGRDAELGKSTYPALLGIEGAKGALTTELQGARACLSEIQQQTSKFSSACLAELIEMFQIS